MEEMKPHLKSMWLASIRTSASPALDGACSNMRTLRESLPKEKWENEPEAAVSRTTRISNKTCPSLRCPGPKLCPAYRTAEQPVCASLHEALCYCLRCFRANIVVTRKKLSCTCSCTRWREQAPGRQRRLGAESSLRQDRNTRIWSRHKCT